VEFVVGHLRLWSAVERSRSCFNRYLLNIHHYPVALGVSHFDQIDEPT
jgi:hypothetical protein